MKCSIPQGDFFNITWRATNVTKTFRLCMNSKIDDKRCELTTTPEPQTWIKRTGLDTRDFSSIYILSYCVPTFYPTLCEIIAKSLLFNLATSGHSFAASMHERVLAIIQACSAISSEEQGPHKKGAPQVRQQHNFFCPGDQARSVCRIAKSEIYDVT